MRKQTKVAAVVSAAALLAIGASMTSFAKGWTVEDNEWVWLDSDDERVYGEWKKSVDGNYYWLDEETGVMATDRIVEDEDATYYVGSTGVRVTNDWVSVENEDGLTVNSEEPDTVYYFMGSNGKAYKAADGKDLVKKSISGATYFFDKDGIMQYGWVEYEYEKDNETKTDYYYCGTEDQGWSYKGWQYVETEYIPEINNGEHEEEAWVYLDGGKLAKNTTKYIDKHYYSFDECGVLEEYWHDPAGIATNGIASGAEAYAYNNGVAAGVLAEKWVEADYDEDGEYKWYYMVSFKVGDKTARAIPFNQGEKNKAAKLIDGRTYLFDGDGKMLTGKQEIKAADATGAKFKGTVSSKALDEGIYYFAKDNNGSIKKGQMLTGKVTHVVDGEEFNYYFAKDGKAYTNALKDNMIYGPKGVRLQAEDGNSYEIKTVTEDVYKVDSKGKKLEKVIAANTQVVVSSTGKLRTSGTVRIDGEKYEIKYNEKDFEYTITWKE